MVGPTWCRVAYRLLGSDCPLIVSRDLLHSHMIFAYSSRIVMLCLAACHGLHLMYGVVLVRCLLLSTDWLNMHMLMLWSWVPSLGGWFIDVSCDTLLTWYFVSHDRLVLYRLWLTLVISYDTTTDSYCTWFMVLWLLACQLFHMMPLLLPTVLGSRYSW